jgi:hypothetical protein
MNDYRNNSNNYQNNNQGDNRATFGRRDRPAGYYKENTPKKVVQTGDGVHELEPGAVRIIPLGGVEEIGRNMTCFEINRCNQKRDERRIWHRVRNH